jgi:hypothetical protein
MRSADPSISRRSVLIGSAALAALGATAAATACGRSPEPPQPDPLLDQLQLAQRDSQLARNAAPAAGRFYGPLLNVVADERAAHAKALQHEISRLANETSPSSTSPTPSAPATPPPSRNDVIAALRESAANATKLAPTLEGYRAGLVGSIAASCTASVTVPLAMTEPTP